MTIIDVDVVQAARQMTLHVEIKREREMMVRIWIACWFIRLAAWIANMGVEFEVREDE